MGSKNLEIHVKTSVDTQHYTLDENATILHLKERLQDDLYVRVVRQKIFYKNASEGNLMDNDTLIKNVINQQEDGNQFELVLPKAAQKMTKEELAEALAEKK